MSEFSVHEAKTHLSKLLAMVERGEEVVITRNRRAVARIVGIEAPKRKPGMFRGKIRISKDFDDPLPAELAEAFGSSQEE